MWYISPFFLDKDPLFETALECWRDACLAVPVNGSAFPFLSIAQTSGLKSFSIVKNPLLTGTAAEGTKLGEKVILLLQRPGYLGRSAIRMAKDKIKHIDANSPLKSIKLPTSRTDHHSTHWVDISPSHTFSK